MYINRLNYDDLAVLKLVERHNLFFFYMANPTLDIQRYRQAYATISATLKISTIFLSIWYDRLGHIGQKVLNKLAKIPEIDIDEGQGPLTNECEPYTLAKMKEIVSRRPLSHPAERPFERLHFDLIILLKAFDGSECLSHVSDERTKAGEVFPLPSKK